MTRRAGGLVAIPATGQRLILWAHPHTVRRYCAGPLPLDAPAPTFVLVEDVNIPPGELWNHPAAPRTIERRVA